jgi:hypothetical protein
MATFFDVVVQTAEIILAIEIVIKAGKSLLSKVR